MEQEVVTSTLTVVKADGPGWLVIAEMVDNGRYRMVRELFGEEPVTEELLRFIDRLPSRWLKTEGAEVELKRPLAGQRVSPKRAARQAAREVAEARDPGRLQPTKAMQIKNAEFDMAKACGQTVRELLVTVWVRYGKKRAAVLEELHQGYRIVEVPGHIADADSNRQVAVTLARHYGADPAQVELVHGYANPQKSFRLILRA
jgi:hypothetical protein